jgi:hypothetical protein
VPPVDVSNYNPDIEDEVVIDEDVEEENAYK